MKPVTLAAGLLMPGAAHWILGQRTKALIYGSMVLTLVAAGAWLHGANSMPTAAELDGVDGTARLMFLSGAAVKTLAGLPYLALPLAGYSQSFMSGLFNEYGTKLLAMAGLVNALALADAFNKETR
jgi:hypothetical protein